MRYSFQTRSRVLRRFDNFREAIISILQQMVGATRNVLARLLAMLLSCSLSLASLIALLCLIATPALAVTYTDNGDGTVTDPTTGLTWMRCSMGQTWTGSTCSGALISYAWDQAMALSGTVSFAGKSDWRLPNIRELETIVDPSTYYPAIDATAFPSTGAFLYWSASVYANNAGSAWGVQFHDGYFNNRSKSETLLVRLVRAGQALGFLDLARPTSNYVDHSDGTVTDTLTGLIWKRCAEGQAWSATDCTGTASTFSWSAAKLVTSTFAGNSDWRIPTTKELATLVDYTATAAPFINATAFPNTSAAYFWSATVAAFDTSAAWSVNFGDGNVRGYNMIGGLQVRLVRGGPLSSSSTSTTTTTTQSATTMTTLAKVPGAPISIGAVAGNTSVTVSFTAPADDGGASITNYTVTSSPGGIIATASTSPITVNGLTNGTSYTFTVTATNSVGTSAPSAASNSVTPHPFVFGSGSYTDNGDGTVTDPSTGLIWMRCQVGQVWDGSTCSGITYLYTFDDAKALDGRSFAGKSDWRVPSIREWLTGFSFSEGAFPNARMDYCHWSGSADLTDATSAWDVCFYNNYGYAFNSARTSYYMVRLVRGALPSAVLRDDRPTSDYVDQADGTVLHVPTGLVWKRCAEGQNWAGDTCSGSATAISWVAAMRFTSDFAGKNDWRVPSLDELFSLVDYTKLNPAMNTTAFPNAPNQHFWSSTPYASDSSYAWNVKFDNGYSYYYQRDGGITPVYLRLVRSAQAVGSFTLNVSKSGAAGWVQSSLGEIRCGSVCSAKFSLGTQVTLVATPGTVVWGGACSGSAETCTVSMDAARDVTAVFSGASTTATIQPKLAARGNTSFSIDSNGHLSGWGSDDSGQLGLGRILQISVPIQIGSGFKTIAAGGSHALAIKTDGSLWAWGDNSSGQLGDGSRTSRASPVLIGYGFSAVAAGFNHSAAVKADGTLWAWGSGSLVGVAGDGNPPNQPVPVMKGTGFSAVAAGGTQTLALKTDGTLWSWGNNYVGSVGDGTNTNRSMPVQIGSGFKAVAAGLLGHSLALKTDGTLWGWGYNGDGELGDGGTTNRNSPTLLGSGYAAVSAGTMHTVALKTDGTVWAWGKNNFGEVGDFSNVDRYSPVFIGSGYVSVLAGGDHSAGMKADDTWWAWGRDASGELGDGLAESRNRPIPISGSFSTMAAGNGFTVALKADGTLWTWGDNRYGALGDGREAVQTNPRPIGDGYSAVASGGSHTVALKPDGTLWAWGGNSSGQLGDGTKTFRSNPVLVTGSGYSAVATGSGHTVALKSDGTLWTWGANYYGQLGDGSYSSHSTPTKVANGYSAVAAGSTYTLALKLDGTLWGWGNNYYGQIGDGSTTRKGSPVLIGGTYKAVDAGDSHAVALKTDGTLWAWGNNSAGQLGDGSTSNRSSPVLIGSGYSAITAGVNHTVALKSDGTLWAWGSNNFGQLGDGSTSNRSSPVQVGSGYVAIAAGYSHTLAMKADGTVWSWGDNANGQLGDGTFATRSTSGLTINENADGVLDLNPEVGNNIPPEKIPPFFVVASGKISNIGASLTTTITKFKAADVGKPGAVFVTAMVPSGSLVPAQSTMSAAAASDVNSIGMIGAASNALTGANPFELVQLTSSGWHPVVNGQVIALASGILGDQFASLTILNGTNTANLGGAEICQGYLTSTDQVINAGSMRAVASIPGGTSSTVATPTSCVLTNGILTIATTTTTTEAPVTTTSSTTITTTASTTTTTLVGGGTATLAIATGWNLLGNGSDAPISVAATFSDTNSFTTVWKWIATQSAWAFHAPSLVAQGGTALADYVTSKGYQLLTTIAGGEGFWVNAKQAGSVALSNGSAISVATLVPTLVRGWNLVSVGETATPKQFCDAQSGGVTTLWAWDATNSAWYFYAPSLDAKGGTALTDYISSKSYHDFTANNKSLGSGVGFWVNKP